MLSKARAIRYDTVSIKHTKHRQRIERNKRVEKNLQRDTTMCPNPIQNTEKYACLQTNQNLAWTDGRTASPIEVSLPSLSEHTGSLEWLHYKINVQRHVRKNKHVTAATRERPWHTTWPRAEGQPYFNARSTCLTARNILIHFEVCGCAGVSCQVVNIESKGEMTEGPRGEIIKWVVQSVIDDNNLVMCMPCPNNVSVVKTWLIDDQWLDNDILGRALL